LHGDFPNHNIDLVNEVKWCFKRPDRLMLNDAMELIELLKDKGIEETLEDLAHLIFRNSHLKLYYCLTILFMELSVATI
jgi:hypothetical protein